MPTSKWCIYNISYYDCFRHLHFVARVPHFESLLLFVWPVLKYSIPSPEFSTPMCRDVFSCFFPSDCDQLPPMSALSPSRLLFAYTARSVIILYPSRGRGRFSTIGYRRGRDWSIARNQKKNPPKKGVVLFSFQIWKHRPI